MPVSQKFRAGKLNQQGMIPIILVIILTVVIAGVGGVIYKSRNEIKVKSDKTSQTTELKDSPTPSPNSSDVALDQTGKLSDKPFELKVDNTVSSPKFSITPPAGWGKLPPNGKTLVEFDAPSKDLIKEGVATFRVQSDITVFVEKGNYKNLDDAVEGLNKEGEDLGYRIVTSQKTKINGDDVYIKESTIDLAQLANQALEEEIAKSGSRALDNNFKKDMDKVIAQAKGRALTYIFYKNGYYVNATGKALESYWGNRGGQLKQSLDTFKFE